tara:strand:- start:2515 stop:2985 length:471 start_codon:yes stop_codon:yes gene_type:complete
MAYFARLDNDKIVLEVISVPQSDVDANGGDLSAQAEQWVSDNIKLGTYKQTFKDASHRGKYAGATNIYKADIDKFVPKQPWDSWVLNSNGWWDPPIAFPNSFALPTDPVKTITIDYTIWDESRGTFVTLDLVNNFSINDNFYWNNSADPKVWVKIT